MALPSGYTLVLPGGAAKAARRSVLRRWLVALVAPVPEALWRQMRTWSLRMRLEALDDRMLDDIGMRRRDIRRVKAPPRQLWRR